MRFSLSSNNFRTLVRAADGGAACAGGLDGVDDVLALESRLAHVHDGVELTKTVVVACEVETLGVVSLDGRVVAVKVLEEKKIIDVSGIERVSREIHILKLVRQPSLIQFYEISLVHNDTFI